MGGVGIAIAGILLGLSLLGTRYELDERGQLGESYIATFSHARHPLDGVLAKGDGQAYAALAQAADLSYPGGFRTRRHMSLRATRPLFAYVTWAVALGRPAWVPSAQAVVEVLSGGFAAVACGELLARRGRSRWTGLLALLLPGAVVAQFTLTSELFGLALVTSGVVLLADDEPCRATFLFALATLARETLVLVPCALVAYAWVHDRRRPSLAPVAVPAGVWVAWLVVLHLRLHLSLFPVTSGGDMAAPFSGLLGLKDAYLTSSLPRRLALGAGLAATAETLATFALTAALWRGTHRRDVLAFIALGHAILAIGLGRAVWSDWTSQARLLLPLYFFGLTALLTRPTRPAAAAAVATHS